MDPSLYPMDAALGMIVFCSIAGVIGTLVLLILMLNDDPILKNKWYYLSMPWGVLFAGWGFFFLMRYLCIIIF